MHRWNCFTLLLLVAAMFAVGGCAGDDGKDGKNGKNGEDGVPGGTSLNASALSDESLESLEVVSEITGVMVSSPPEVTFTLMTSAGVPITGIVPFWEASDSYVRFTMTKLVPGVDGAPNNWVAYTRDADTNAPDYDKGSSLVDNGDGSYTFTFNTDVTAVPGVTWEPTLTHRVAGQIGSRSVPLAPQNLIYDYIPDGGEITTTRAITTMQVCNECHDDLVFHGRRFETEYCSQCHNPELAEGEGDMSFMIHKIHAAGTFEILDDAIDYSHLTYPQDLANCRKCHEGTKEGTPDGDNWMNVPSIAACAGCHDVEPSHGGGGGGQGCLDCHNDTVAPSVEMAHLTANATPNNPHLLPGQVSITYELVEATVDGANQVTIKFKVLSDGTPIDVTNLPTDLATPGRFPGFLLAWAAHQDGIDNPQDYNNLGLRAGQPISLGLDAFSPLETMAPIGTMTFDAGTGVNTALVTDVASNFPDGATLRAIGLQGYFQQDIDGDTVSLHTPSAVVAVNGDDVRRTVVDSASCSSCHEWFEGHGGNRTYNIQICTLCHVPNLSSTGRSVTDPTARGLDTALAEAIAAGTLSGNVNPGDPLTYPEDAQNLKDMIHGIHSSGDRTRPYQHIRGPSRQGYYDWEHVTFPRGASTANCKLCHIDGTIDLPLAEGLLGTTVRTTRVADGQDATGAEAEAAFVGVPNATDWINSPTSSSCFYCHTSNDAMAHMMQNGGLLSLPTGGMASNRSLITSSYESCSVCHGPGKTADLEHVHSK